MIFLILQDQKSHWSTNAKKVWVKASDGWKSATRLFAKTVAGWVQMWPGDAPASSLTDPIDIRLTGYNDPRASSPEYINTVLYGNDGTITGATPITVNSRRMKISEDNTGNTTRYQLETTDVYNLTSNSETDIGFKRFMAECATQGTDELCNGGNDFLREMSIAMYAPGSAYMDDNGPTFVDEFLVDFDFSTQVTDIGGKRRKKTIRKFNNKKGFGKNKRTKRFGRNKRTKRHYIKKNKHSKSKRK